MHCELAISVLNSSKWFENLKFDFNLEFPKLTKAKTFKSFNLTNSISLASLTQPVPDQTNVIFSQWPPVSVTTSVKIAKNEKFKAPKLLNFFLQVARALSGNQI